MRRNSNYSIMRGKFFRNRLLLQEVSCILKAAGLILREGITDMSDAAAGKRVIGHDEAE